MTERLENAIAKIKLMFLLGHSVTWNLLLLVIVRLCAFIVYMYNFMYIHMCLYVIYFFYIYTNLYKFAFI